MTVNTVPPGELEVGGAYTYLPKSLLGGEMANPEIKALLESLETDLNSARMSRAIFVAGNGANATVRAKMHEAFAGSYAANAFLHVMNTALRDTALAIARITDPIGTDRLSLSKLGRLLEAESAQIVEDASRWYADIDGSKDEGPLGKQSRAMVTARLPVLILDIKKFLSSPAIKAIRSLRDASLAHTLDIAHLPVAIDDVETAFSEANRLVAEASLLATGIEWDPDQFDEGPLLYANDLWDAVEFGLPEVKKHDKRNTPRVKF